MPQNMLNEIKRLISEIDSLKTEINQRLDAIDRKQQELEQKLSELEREPTFAENGKSEADLTAEPCKSESAAMTEPIKLHDTDNRVPDKPEIKLDGKARKGKMSSLLEKYSD